MRERRTKVVTTDKRELVYTYWRAELCWTWDWEEL